MAKITTYIPEPAQEYSPDNQRQVLQALETLKDQLNFSFQEDLKQDLQSGPEYHFSLVSTLHKVHFLVLSNDLRYLSCNL